MDFEGTQEGRECYATQRENLIIQYLGKHNTDHTYSESFKNIPGFKELCHEKDAAGGYRATYDFIRVTLLDLKAIGLIKLEQNGWKLTQDGWKLWWERNPDDDIPF